MTTFFALPKNAIVSITSLSEFALDSSLTTTMTSLIGHLSFMPMEFRSDAIDDDIENTVANTSSNSIFMNSS